MEWEHLASRLAEEAERRFYGKYRGVVVDNADPESLGRLKVRVPTLLGDKVVTGWAAPCVPYGGAANQGMLFVPEVGAHVWVEFEAGDLEFPVWVGTFWVKPGGDSGLPRPNGPDGAEGSVQSPPTRKIVKTLAGHTLQFEDEDQEVRVLLADGQGENRIVLGKTSLTVVYKGNTITLSDDGIVIEDTNGNTITQDGSGMVIEDANGNTVTQAASGTVIEDANGNSITMDATSGGIPGTPGIAANGAKKVCLDGLITFLMSHTHIGNMGAPTPLNPADIAKLTAALAVPDGDILSQKVTLG